MSLQYPSWFTEGFYELFQHAITSGIYIICQLWLQPAIQYLHLFSYVDAIPANEFSEYFVFGPFPFVFSDFGQFKGRLHQICIKDDAIPFALTTPRQVALSITGQVFNHLHHVEFLDIIIKINKLMNWYVRMVVVPKANGTI